MNGRKAPYFRAGQVLELLSLDAVFVGSLIAGTMMLQCGHEGSLMPTSLQKARL